MIITNITFNDGIYTITYAKNKETINEIKKLMGKISATTIDKESLDRFNFLTEDIKDSFWISEDEYIILIPKEYPCLPDDLFIPLGKMRYYITNHMEEECIFTFDIKETEEDIDATELQFAISSFLNWD